MAVVRNCRHCGKQFRPRWNQLKAGTGWHCSQACSGAAKADPTDERFWRKVNKTETCWLWTGGMNAYGYGSLMLFPGRRVIGAHRLSWELHNGPIPDGLFVCHKCDVRNCVNPNHLFLGTSDDNIKDAAQKGRMAKSPEWRAKVSAINSVVAPKDIATIRRRYLAGGISYKKLGAEYGVTGHCIYRILKGLVSQYRAGV